MIKKTLLHSSLRAQLSLLRASGEESSSSTSQDEAGASTYLVPFLDRRKNRLVPCVSPQFAEGCSPSNLQAPPLNPCSHQASKFDMTKLQPEIMHSTEFTLLEAKVTNSFACHLFKGGKLSPTVAAEAQALKSPVTINLLAVEHLVLSTKLVLSSLWKSQMMGEIRAGEDPHEFSIVFISGISFAFDGKNLIKVHLMNAEGLRKIQALLTT